MSDDWFEKFDSRCNELLLKRARRYAILRAQHHGWEMPSAGPFGPDDIVDNVIRDTLSGVLRWDPETRLDWHLFDAIRSRIRRHAKRMSRFPHESIDALDSDGVSPTLTEAEDKLLAESPESTQETQVRLTEVIHSLRKLASGKPLVQKLLTAYAQHVIEKEDVMEVANLTSAEYDTAHRHLARLTERLPRHLQPRATKVTKGA